MGETDYGAIFGAETNAGAGAAEPANDAQGAKEQDVADPAAEQTEDGSEADGTEGTDSQADGKAQSPEVNSRYATARRKAEAERDAAVLKARQEAAAETTRQFEERLSSLGLYNPYTKQPIRTVADMEVYHKGKQDEAKRKLMAAGNMTEEQYNQYVADLPEVKAARESKAASDEAAQKVMANEARAKLDSQMAEISALDPNIRTVEDLKNMENYDRFYELVKRGNSLIDAYKLANMDKLTAGNTAAARQAALNSANSKNHLDRTTTRGAGTVTVPRDIAESYRAMMPGITDAEIAAHYNKYHTRK